MVLVSLLVFVVVFLVEVECEIPLTMTGPRGTGKTSFVQTIVNASIELETTATRTNNNNEDDSIADEDGCFPSQERDGQQEEIVVLTSFIGQVYQSFVLTFISSMYNICRDMNKLILWPLFILPFSYTSAIKPPYIHVGKMAKGMCMETIIPSADHDVLFTRGISASME